MVAGVDPSSEDILLCSKCFQDFGLRYDAVAIGLDDRRPCPRCGTTEGAKLTKRLSGQLAYRFFVRGTIVRLDYGGAPRIQFNDQRYGEIDVGDSLELQHDARLLADAARVGFFPYGPRLWMLGEVEPLKALQRLEDRDAIIGRVISEYPGRLISTDEHLVRLRKAPKDPIDPSEYDSPPPECYGAGRLDCDGSPILYASQDIEVCVHECRVTVEDELYLATLAVERPLRCLDLTAVSVDGVSEFESLDMAVHMLFLAGPHSYEICRSIARKAEAAGFDGIVYPSYFSLVRTGAPPFETAYGISIRRFASQRPYAEAIAIPNVAVFGRPVRDRRLRVACVNRLVLSRVAYDVVFGPAQC